MQIYIDDMQVYSCIYNPTALRCPLHAVEPRELPSYTVNSHHNTVKLPSYTPSRPVPDPAGPAAAETVTGTGTDAMITDATAASSSVLVTDSCMRATCHFFCFACASRRYMVGCTRHMPSHPLQKRFRPLVVALVLGRRCPKRGILLRVRKASWPLLLKWLVKSKLVVKHLKLKELMLKVKVRSCRKLLTRIVLNLT